MKFKASDLSGDALDIAAAIALGYTVEGTVEEYGHIRWRTPDNVVLCWAFTPTTDWSRCGPIIECEAPWVRESAAASPAIAHLVTPDKKWFAYTSRRYEGGDFGCYYGETFLVAAMRCFVASKLGKEVEIPDELLLAA